MRKLSLVSTLPFIAAALMAACGSDSDSTDGGATTNHDGSSGGGDVAKTGDGAVGEAGGGDAAGASKFVAIMIVDKDSLDMVACNATNGPGSDIDAVQLLTSNDVSVGVGLKGSASYAVGDLATNKPCEDAMCAGGKCKYSDKALKDRAEGPRDAEVKAVGDDVGYFSLNNGRLVLQIGDDTGGGTAKDIMPGMKVKVWEVDQVYKTDKKAPDTCKCIPEKYEVYALRTLTDTNALRLVPGTVATDNATACGTVPAGSGCGTTVFTIPTD